jgi:hypothetical protein
VMGAPERPVILLSTLHSRPAHDAELAWFFNRAEGQMGVGSTFHASLGARCPRAAQPTPEEMVEAAYAYRRILGWLCAMPRPLAGVLQVAYASRPWPTPLYDAAGRLTGIVVRLACRREPWPHDPVRQQAVENTRAELLAVDCERYKGFGFGPVVRLRREAHARFTKAHRAYARARGRRHCVVGRSS